ncbi:hypothetical protein DYB37_005169 [Aphanomyces astaci]|uniref:HIG1 domain-containing protein n=1 Tax=Aphanomyces astaci TaxID=112090 RepID=A0A397CPE1_APHAT|nr:hypothetical protein DYB30_010793 [Aphanomyces astaci]RHY51670.1 hypothetical protein DYB38_007153 [Aphanomyces astaci]RHY95667.1 hypothetical protein DYB35_004805 [Aphanomyces astaci]RHZ12027.1 hypothetical protein DYB37_005169 [Aphanomyces astaci]RHZ42585.1 hypothetical protein DYB26_013042 [Aphanomyces astaci]
MSTAETRDIITSNSATLGLQAGAVATVVAGAGATLAHYTWPFFRNRLGVSGKVGLVASAGMATFIIVAERDLLRGSRNPDEYINDLQAKNNTASPSSPATAGKSHSLPLHHHFANYLLDYPFRTLAMTATPLVGAIYLHQSRNNNIQFSQKIMHTRIYGQGTCVVLLLSTMAMYDFMSRRGRYE